MKLAQRIEDVLTTLYDYEYIDIEKWYNYNENGEGLKVLNKVISSGDINENDTIVLKNLYEDLSSYIRMETNYNSEIGDF